jgi:hypothetical protein
MRTEYKAFGIISGCLYAFAVIYAWWTHSQHMFDWAGTMVLLFGGTLGAILGGYFAFVARRIPPRPSDRQTASIEEGAGPIGWFSPSSYWPLGIGLSVLALSLGLASQELWLAVAGLGVVLITVAGLLFENYVHGRHGRTG